MKNREQYNFGIVVATAVVILCRFCSVYYTPDVFCDENEILMQMQSIIKTGYDTQGNYMPLYSQAGLGLVTFTYMYPMMFFLFIVGVSEIKARLVQQCLTILACYLVAKGMQLWTTNSKMFWITFLTGLTLPWGFVQSNRVWDPSFVPIYFSLYFFFFTLLMKKEQKKRSETYIYVMISFTSLVLLATVYPSARIPAVAMWIYSLIWAIREKRIEKTHILITFIVSTLVALPLAINLLDPSFNSRSADMVVFFQDLELYQMIHSIKWSFFELFNPSFLFAGGDKIYRHSLPIWGVLGTLNVIPFIVLLRTKKMSSLSVYMFFVISATYLSSALTYEYQPHALRSCLAWMPFVVLLSYGWLEILEMGNKKKRVFWYSAMSLQFVLYFLTYIVYFKNV